jgi:hypothetical protein
LALLAASAACAQPGATAVAVYYDGPSTPLAEGFLDAYQIQNLLGHFGLTADIVAVDRYGPGQLDGYRAAFFAGTASGTQLPQAFLADIASYDRPFCWIGRHVGKLLEPRGAQRRFGFRYLDYRDDLEFRQVVYKGVTLPKEDPDLNLVEVTDPGAVQVVATAVNDERERRPYALRRGRFWYIADTPFSYAEEGGRYLVFCDLLHDILEIPHPPQSLALARIEDVSAEIDPADLRELAGVLASRSTPFQIAVIPVFRNPAKGYEIRLTDRPDLVEAIRYMIARGGTAVMHGATHQHDGASGDDYEFWDEIKNRPVPGDSEEAVSRKVELGLAEMFAGGIHPLAFETPHYAASEAGYRALKAVFTLFNERTMATADIGSIQYFPYPVTDRFGRFIVPENLGYLDAGAPDPKVLIQRARNLRVVRDGVASFYFHAFLDPALLREVVDGVTGLGYKFVSLRQYGGEVNFRGRMAVRATRGVIRLTPNQEYWRSRSYDQWGGIVREQSSRTTQSGGVELSVEIPPEGWAAAECTPAAPGPAPTPGLAAKLRDWWRKLRPSRRPLEAGTEFAGSAEAWVLWDDRATGAASNNQRSYQHVLEIFGYRVTRSASFVLPPARQNAVLVVPEAAGRRLEEQQAERLLRYLEAGGRVVADGRQEWLSKLGFEWLGRRIPVTRVVDVLYPEMALRWQPEELVERFRPPADAEQLMVDPASRQELALAGSHGLGRFIHLAAPLDSHTARGTSHYPYFAEYLGQGFRQPVRITSPRIEVYFDPAFRDEVNLSRLAGYWRRSGIRLVYAAAWQFYPRHAFDYANFVRICHRNGISVYAWFALPAVTPQFWDEHPEWRERTAAGGDGRVGWRPSMNLQNPACFRAAMDRVKQILEACDWDGVNLTELNYDADFNDFLRPDRFVPMNGDVRAEFRARAGFDPALLFAPGSPYHHKKNPEALEQFLAYREDVVTDWHRRVLRELAPLASRRGWEVVVTMLDSLHSEYVRPALGVNSGRLAGLMKEFDFTLQVEDPAEHWMQSPDRYLRFAETYLKLVPDRRRLMFDVNVMPDRDVAGASLPSPLATGTELADTILAASSASGRAAIYSEHTVAGQDWNLIGAALARSSRVSASGGRWTTTADVPLRLRVPEDGEYYLGGSFWPAVSGDGLLLPPGKQRVAFKKPWFQFLDPSDLPARLLHTSGDLLEAKAKPTGLSVSYRSPGRAVVLLNQRPLAVRVDDRDAELPVVESGEAWALLAPRGEHRIEIDTSTRAGLVVSFWAWISASVIAGFGAVTTAAMAAIYLHLRLRRASRRKAGS